MSRRPPLPRALLAVAALTATVALAACGDAGRPDRPQQDVVLGLDFTPNAVHAGIFTAATRGFDTAEGVDLEIRRPGSSADGLRLLVARRVDVAVVDLHDLALARERGQDLVAVMALVQRPLAAVIARPGIRRPRDLEGRRAGVAGLPSDDAVLDAVVRGDGGDPGAVRRTTIGFEAVRALLAGRVAAATAFWNAEGVALRRERPGFRVFRVDEYGAPSYPELVLVARRETVEDDPEVLEAVAAALGRGYTEVLANPDSAVEDLVTAEDGLEREAVAAELDAVAPAFRFEGGPVGELDPGRLAAWARWEREVGITREAPDVRSAFRPDLARAATRDTAVED